MNNKGFTLIEVIITLSILVVLSLILIPTVNTIIEKQNQNSLKNFVESVESATLNYVKENKWELEWINCVDGNPSHSITIKELIISNYLQPNIKNPVTKEEINIEDPNYTIIATYNCANKTFTAKASSDFKSAINLQS